MRLWRLIALAGWLAVGLPPQQNGRGDPLSWTKAMFVVVGVALSVYFSVRLVTWVYVKLDSMKLFSEVRRELHEGKRRPWAKSR